MLSATKKIILAVLLLAVAVSAAPLPARAQFDESGMTGAFATPAATQQTIANTAGLNNSNAGAGYGSTPSCSLNPETWDMCLSNVVYVFTIGIGSQLAYLGAFFFNFMVQLTLNSAAYALDFLTTGWSTVRDLANMFFIFILIYTAFEIMFRAESVGTMRRIALIIIMALLINFSFFITRVVIDTGNILALQFYNAINVPTFAQTKGGAGGATGTTVSTTAANFLSTSAAQNTKDLTISIMNAVQVQRLFDTAAFDTWRKNNKTSFLTSVITLSFLYIVLGAMYVLLFGVFLMAGIKFMMRVVGLWFVIISAPLAFVARTLTNTEKFYKQWQEYLIKFSFYPAVFLFMFYLVVNFMNGLSPTTGGFINGIFNELNSANAQGAGVGLLDAMGTVAIKLGFVIAMMYVTLRASDWIVKESSGMFDKATGWVTGAIKGTIKPAARFGGGLPLRGAAATGAFVGRNTAGWAGNALARSTWARNLAGSQNLVSKLTGKALRAGGKYVGDSSFDARNLPGGSTILSGGGLIDVGKGQKGGFITSSNKSVKARETYAKDLEPTAGEKLKARMSAETDKEIKYTERSEDIKQREIRNKEEEDQAKLLQDPQARDTALRQVKAKKAYTSDLKKELEDEVNKKAKELSGEGLKKKYGEGLTVSTNIAAGNPGFVRRVNYEAGAKIVSGKSTEAKVKEVLEEMVKAEGGHDDDHPPTTPSGGGTKKPGGGDTTKATGSTDTHAPASSGDTAHFENLTRAVRELRGTVKDLSTQIAHGNKPQRKPEESLNMRAVSQKIGERIAESVTEALSTAPQMQPPKLNTTRMTPTGTRIGTVAPQHAQTPPSPPPPPPPPPIQPPSSAANDNRPPQSGQKAA